MQDYTFMDYFRYITAKEVKKDLEFWLQPRPDPKDFWDAAFQYDPLRQISAAGSVELGHLTHPSRFGVVTLGRLYGDGPVLGVIPEMGALPESDIGVENFTTLPFARTASCAISYPDGHPSHEYTYDILVRPTDDKKLRRFTSLGWVMQKFGDGTWEMMGHVLVMDMDRGRDRHPWIVLAHEWTNNDGEGPRGDFKHHAPRTVKRNNPNSRGVFPGDNNRTTIAKIVQKDPVEGDKRPILKRFDSNFQFLLARGDGDRENVRTEFGPDLAHVMAWYRDERAKEEICYGRDGQEYMRYNTNARGYTYRNLGSSSTEGELDLSDNTCSYLEW